MILNGFTFCARALRYSISRIYYPLYSISISIRNSLSRMSTATKNSFSKSYAYLKNQKWTWQ